MNEVPVDSTAHNGATKNRYSECRLCGGSLAFSFSKLVVGKYLVEYLRCSNCLSLQSEVPYWLDEAYTHPVPAADAGYIRRNLDVTDAALFLRKVLRMAATDRILDFGSGLGIVPRLLRE